jgi:hypothetical protein
MNQNGVLYIAIGENYRSEAALSISSLRLVNPNLPTCVLSDKPWDQGGKPPEEFQVIDFKQNHERWSNLAAKPLHLNNSPFARTLFLDTDTYIARDLSPLFDLLHFYDIGARSGGTPICFSDQLRIHPFYATGGILYTRSSTIAEFFEHWQQRYKDLLAGTQDEARSFSLAIAETRVRFVTLDSYVLLDLNGTIGTQAPPFIYHGRSKPFSQINSEVISDWDPATDYHVRLWLPSIQGFLPRGISRSDPMLASALLLRRFTNIWRRRLSKTRARR